jgi:hypothetical protein
MNKEQKIELVNKFRKYYAENIDSQKLGVFFVIAEMFCEANLTTLELTYLILLFEPKYALQEIEVIENLHWIDEQIDLISYEN